MGYVIHLAAPARLPGHVLATTRNEMNLTNKLCNHSTGTGGGLLDMVASKPGMI
jgi:hypothetical protein